MTQIIKLVTAAGILGLLPLSCLNLGCTFKTKDNASWQLTFGSQVGINTSSATTNAQGEVSTDFPSAEAWFFSKAKQQEKKIDAESDNVPDGGVSPSTPMKAVIVNGTWTLVPDVQPPSTTPPQ